MFLPCYIDERKYTLGMNDCRVASASTTTVESEIEKPADHMNIYRPTELLKKIDRRRRSYSNGRLLLVFKQF